MKFILCKLWDFCEPKESSPSLLANWMENKWRSPDESSPIVTIMKPLYLALLMRHTKEAWNQLEEEFSLQVNL